MPNANDEDPDQPAVSLRQGGDWNIWKHLHIYDAVTFANYAMAVVQSLEFEKKDRKARGNR